MTVDQIDKALADWRSKISAASANLLEFDDLLTYKRLRGTQGLPPPRLSGISEKRVKPALDAIPLLWKYLQMLTNVINEAGELRKAYRIWNADNTVRQIEDLLKGASITLLSEETPLSQRGLLSDAMHTESTTPKRLLAFMTETFETAKAAILDVDAAWQRMEPALASSRNEINALRTIALTLGEVELQELGDAEQRIHALQTAVQNDPLGVDASFQTEVSPHLQRVRDRLNDLKQQREQMHEEMVRARRLLTQTKETNRQSRLALEECRRKFLNVAGLREPLPDVTVADLEQWFETLEETFRLGRWRPARVGLERWLQTARTHSLAATTALNANRAPIELKAELSGRLSSLRAKSLAFKKRGMSIDPSVERLADKAEGLLRQVPLPLNEAANCVAEYETALNRALRS